MRFMYMEVQAEVVKAPIEAITNKRMNIPMIICGCMCASRGKPIKRRKRVLAIIVEQQTNTAAIIDGAETVHVHDNYPIRSAVGSND